MDLKNKLLKAGAKAYPTEAEYVAEKIKEFAPAEAFAYQPCAEMYEKYCYFCVDHDYYVSSDRLFGRALKMAYGLNTGTTNAGGVVSAVYLPVDERGKEIDPKEYDNVIRDFKSRERIIERNCSQVYYEFCAYCSAHGYIPPTPRVFTTIMHNVYNLCVIQARVNGKLRRIFVASEELSKYSITIDRE